jgi:hypothetical protein
MTAITEREIEAAAQAIYPLLQNIIWGRPSEYPCEHADTAEFRLARAALEAAAKVREAGQ